MRPREMQVIHPFMSASLLLVGLCGLALPAAAFDPSDRRVAEPEREQTGPTGRPTDAPSGGVNAHVSLNALMAIPTGDYGRTLDDEGYGLEGSFGVQLGDSPITMGLHGGWYRFSTERRMVSELVGYEFLSDNTFMGHMLLRIQPRWRYFRPFAEVMGGFRSVLATRTTDRGNGKSVVFEQSETVGSWGVAAGVDLMPMPLSRRSDGPALGFSFGVRSLWSSEAEYGIPAPAAPGGFVTRRSDIRAWMPFVGMTLHAW